MKLTKKQQEIRADGWNAGHHAGIEDGKRIAKQEIDNQRIILTNNILQQAAHFQECMTKLILSINRDL